MHFNSPQQGGVVSKAMCAYSFRINRLCVSMLATKTVAIAATTRSPRVLAT